LKIKTNFIKKLWLMGNILICGDRLLAGDSIHKKTIPFEDGFLYIIWLILVDYRRKLNRVFS
jgi:hypothetical protein